MAIEILAEPPSKASVNNEILFVVNESIKANDPVTYPDYKYICNVYVSAALVSTLKATPDPVNRFGVFNVSDILRSYVSYGLDASATVVDYDSNVAYQVEFTEEHS